MAQNAAIAAGPFNFSVNFTYGGQSINVPFRAWAPDGIDRVRGVVLSVPGSGGDSRNETASGPLQTRLDPMGFAVVGTRSVDPSNPYWGVTTNEIAANMQAMLNALAGSMARPEVRNAPLFPYGISQGGFAAAAIAQAIPERTLGFFVDKGTQYAYPGFGDSQRHVPGMMVAGQYDDTVTPGTIYGAFQSWQPQAEVAFVADWNVPHLATRPDLRHTFLDEVIKVRYPQNQVPSLEPNHPLPLVNVPYSAGWLSQTNQVYADDLGEHIVPHVWPTTTPASVYPLPEPASWLPSETMAMAYRAHVDRPVGIAPNSWTLTSALAADPLSAGSPIVDLTVELANVPYASIDLYHGNQLFAELGPASGVRHVIFRPTTNGNHTFIALAEYEFGGQTHFTSMYISAFVLGAKSAEQFGDFNQDGVVDAADLAVWSQSFGQSGPGVAGDGDRDGDVDGADLLVWQKHVGVTLGATQPGLQGNAQVVPEPAGTVLIVLASAATMIVNLASASRGCASSA